jgi:DNA-binding response OmpR family regulator
MLRSLGASAPVVVSETLVVLVAEENAVFRSITAGHLTAAGFEVLEAANSAEAEQILKSTAVDALMGNLGVMRAGTGGGPIGRRAHCQQMT